MKIQLKTDNNTNNDVHARKYSDGSVNLFVGKEMICFHNDESVKEFIEQLNLLFSDSIVDKKTLDANAISQYLVFEESALSFIKKDQETPVLMTAKEFYETVETPSDYDILSYDISTNRLTMQPVESIKESGISGKSVVDVYGMISDSSRTGAANEFAQISTHSKVLTRSGSKPACELALGDDILDSVFGACTVHGVVSKIVDKSYAIKVKGSLPIAVGHHPSSRLTISKLH